MEQRILLLGTEEILLLGTEEILRLGTKNTAGDIEINKRAVTVPGGGATGGEAQGTRSDDPYCVGLDGRYSTRPPPQTCSEIFTFRLSSCFFSFVLFPFVFFCSDAHHG